MATIPQRELRNNVSDVLRRVESGERFTITVNGRPVAELSPLRDVPGAAPIELLDRIIAENPVDGSWAEDLRKMREEDLRNSRDPWVD